MCYKSKQERAIAPSFSRNIMTRSRIKKDNTYDITTLNEWKASVSVNELIPEQENNGEKKNEEG